MREKDPMLRNWSTVHAALRRFREMLVIVRGAIVWEPQTNHMYKIGILYLLNDDLSSLLAFVFLASQK